MVHRLGAALRAGGVPVPVVFMSAGDRLRHGAATHRADGYLTKPLATAAILVLAGRVTTASQSE